jgi:hypothetical protein
MTFRLTYSTMFNPPPELHERFDAALDKVRGTLGENHDHFIDGADVGAADRIEDLSPINTNWVLGKFPAAGVDAVNAAVAAANAAFPGWRATPMQERNRRDTNAGAQSDPEACGRTHRRACLRNQCSCRARSWQESYGSNWRGPGNGRFLLLLLR